jgi:antirestriction protein ArdC
MKESDRGGSLTYDQWKELGFHVRKGEKATGHSLEGATFKPSQVDEDELDTNDPGWDGDVAD